MLNLRLKTLLLTHTSTQRLFDLAERLAESAKPFSGYLKTLYQRIGADKGAKTAATDENEPKLLPSGSPLIGNPPDESSSPSNVDGSDSEILSQENAKLKGQLDELKLALLGQTTELKNEIHDLKQRNSELLERVVQLTQKERKLAQQVVETRFQGSGVKAERERLDRELREVKRSLAAFSEQMERSEARAADAEGKRRATEDLLREKSNEIAGLEEKLKQSSGSNERRLVGSEISTTPSMELAMLKTAVTQLQKAMAELRSVVDGNRENDLLPVDPLKRDELALADQTEVLNRYENKSKSDIS